VNPAVPITCGDGSPNEAADDRVLRQRFVDFTFTNLELGLKETADDHRRIL
jgi:hypothetical protein